MLLEQHGGAQSKCNILLYWKGHDEGYWAPDLTLLFLNCCGLLWQADKHHSRVLTPEQLFIMFPYQYKLGVYIKHIQLS